MFLEREADGLEKNLRILYTITLCDFDKVTQISWALTFSAVKWVQGKIRPTQYFATCGTPTTHVT